MEPTDPADTDYKIIEVPRPFSADRMKPARTSVREGRVNPKGIPCLYLADDANTAMAETRPWLNSYISVAEFKICKSLRIVDCSDPKSYVEDPFCPPDVRQPDAPEREKAVWGEIAYAFSEPVSPSDSTAEYAPTQVVAEAFKNGGYDGIRYKSLLDKGHSFSLFDLDSANVSSRLLFRTRKLLFDFEREGNPSVHADPCPDVESLHAGQAL